MAVQPQSGGGGRGSSYSYRGSGGYTKNRGGQYFSGQSCDNSECTVKLDVTVLLIIIGVVIGGSIVVKILLCMCQSSRGVPSQSNAYFVNNKSAGTLNCDSYPFKTGVWWSRFRQNGKWSEFYRVSLWFDNRSSKVTGEGQDIIGSYTVDGIFSSEKRRLALTKSYLLGTGNPAQNLGHDVTIQLTWNVNHHQFEGKWYIRITNYRGEDQFELKLEASSVSLLEANDYC